MYSKQHQVAPHHIAGVSLSAAFAYDNQAAANCLYASKPPAHHALFDACRLTSFSDVSPDVMYAQMMQQAAAADARMTLQYPPQPTQLPPPSSLTSCAGGVTSFYQQQQQQQAAMFAGSDNAMPAHQHHKRPTMANNHLFSPAMANDVTLTKTSTTSAPTLKAEQHHQQQQQQQSTTWMIAAAAAAAAAAGASSEKTGKAGSMLKTASNSARLSPGSSDCSLKVDQSMTSSSRADQGSPSSSGNAYFPWMKTTKSHARQWKAHWLGMYTLTTVTCILVFRSTRELCWLYNKLAWTYSTSNVRTRGQGIKLLQCKANCLVTNPAPDSHCRTLLSFYAQKLWQQFCYSVFKLYIYVLLCLICTTLLYRSYIII